MDNKLNITYITFDGYVEMNKYRYLYFVIMFTAYILIICSNSTIVCLIVIHQNLHEPMYIFIAALSLNSVLFSTVIYPKLFADFLSEKPIISYSACVFQWFMYYTVSGSEFLLLSAMAYDRYVSICKPLQYPTIMRKTTVRFILVTAWFLPACQVAVPPVLNGNRKLCYFTLKGIICNSTIYKLNCILSNKVNIYGLVVLVNSVIMPVLFILFTYIRIFVASYQSCRAVKKKAALTCLPHLLVLANFTYLVVFDVLLQRLDADLPKIVHLVMTLQMTLYHPLINPFIYGLKMKEIYKHLKRLLNPCNNV